MKQRTLTIEEMIAAGASWAEITTRVKEMQRELEEKKRAEEQAKAERAKKAEVTTAAKERLVMAFADWIVAEGLIAAEEKEDFSKEIAETIDSFEANMRQAAMIEKILRLR